MANLGTNINTEFTNTLTITPNGHDNSFSIPSPNQPDDVNELLYVKVGTITGGYDPEFFQESMEDHFVCPICKGVLHNPALIVECGHVFCENCLEENNRYQILFNYTTLLYTYTILLYKKAATQSNRLETPLTIRRVVLI